jgi:glutamate racemase
MKSNRVQPNCAAAIGLFDSGVGGLTVLRQIQQRLPQESIIYFGDTAHLPYGDKTPQQILQYVREILTWMVAARVKLVIMACNTSSALALETVRSEFDIPILGLILPGAKAAVQAGRHIGVIATPPTAASNAYRNAILEINPTARVWQIGCPEFVPLIEQNRIHDPYTLQVTQAYLAPLLEQRIDALIYGCTHYPYLEPVLRQILPAQVRLIDPAISVVAAADQEMDLLALRNLNSDNSESISLPQPVRFCVSGSAKQFAQAACPWLGYTPMVEQVNLPALSTIALTQIID